MELTDNPSELTDKRQRFIDEYLKDCNATKAAIRAGYAASGARQEGSRLLSNADIRREVDRRLKLLEVTVDEAIKHIGDIATTRLNDYMVVRPVQSHEMLEEYVTVLMTRKKQKIRDIEAFIGRNKLDAEGRKPFDALISRIRMELLEDEQEVERWGDDVSRLVQGKPVVGYVADVDLVKVARAKGLGRIKSLKHTKEGVQIEMYAADAALRDILKMAGKFVERKDITSGGQRITGIAIVDFDEDDAA